jgi:prephenate dehydrogenase
MKKFKNIGIVGLGLIGSSIALEIKKRKLSEKTTGFSRRLETLKKAKEKGLIDEYFQNFEEGLKDLDFLILATPIEIVKEYFTKIKKEGSKVLVTDVASIKEKIVEESLNILGKENNFVPSHPMAGSEKSGMDGVKDNLFEEKYVIITPTDNTDKNNISVVEGFWESLGAKTFFLSPSEHDKLIGLTSHFPHLMVYSLMSLFEKHQKKEVLFRCVGTGFSDTTRIGKSNPDLWANIFLTNKKNMIYWIEEYEKALQEIKELLLNDSFDKLRFNLSQLKMVREKVDEKE